MTAVDRAAETTAATLVRLNVHSCEEHYRPESQTDCWDIMDYDTVAAHIIADLADAGLLVTDEYARRVSWRCPQMGKHMYDGLAIPCPECYSIESHWRRIPYEPAGAWDAYRASRGEP